MTTDRLPRNDEIKARWVRLVNPRHDEHPEEASLLEPARTKDVLARINLETTMLIQVDTTVNPPVCKLVDKAEYYQAEKAARLAKKARKSGGPKEVQLTWAVTPNDLLHKLKPAIKALAEGAKVSIVVSTPPGRLGATSRSKQPEEKKELAASLDRLLEEHGGHKIGETFEGQGVFKMTQKWERKPGAQAGASS